MTDLISTLGIQIGNTNIITAGQKDLARLNLQLASGKFSQDLTDYSPNVAKNLLNLNSALARREGFLGSIQIINTRLKVYDQSMTGMEKVAALASSLTNTSPSYNPDTNNSTAEQIKGFMQQVSFYLNQQVGDRYIFSGTRYGTVPVTDITALPLLNTGSSTALVADPVLPDYDTDAPANDATAYIQDQVSIDTTQKLQYGITSTQDSFQQLILGLRFAYSATQDQANYSALMSTARDLINDGLSGMRAIHSDLAASQDILNNVQTRHNSGISDAKNEIGDIQNVDVNEVAVKITTYKTQLEASYAATAQMTQLTILNYL